MVALLIVLAIAVVVIVVLIWAIDQTGIPYPASPIPPACCSRCWSC